MEVVVRADGIDLTPGGVMVGREDVEGHGGASRTFGI